MVCTPRIICMNMIFHKYQGAGNDFLIADNRDGHITEKDGVLTAVLPDGSVWTRSIADLCDRRYGVGADGLMLLDPGTGSKDCLAGKDMTSSSAETNGTDFHMTYFNSDGSGGMMCGNGGRCIVAFAHDCGLPGTTTEDGLLKYDFTAADGPHEAYILKAEGPAKTIRLKMKDVHEAQAYETLTGPQVPSQGWFLDTGTRHYVRFIKDMDTYDIVTEGREIRYKAMELQPIGANVNFVEPEGGRLKVRTYEKGVEDETFACGTGIVASALASYIIGVDPGTRASDGRVSYEIQAKRDQLSVDFIPEISGVASDVFLTGPAVYVGKIFIFA